MTVIHPGANVEGALLCIEGKRSEVLRALQLDQGRAGVEDVARAVDIGGLV